MAAFLVFFSMGIGAQTVTEVERRISDAKFNMTAACTSAWKSQSYAEYWSTVRFDERAAVERARDTYDNIEGLGIPDRVNIPDAAHGFVGECRDKLERPYRQFWQLERLQARKREEQEYQPTSQRSAQQPISHPSVTSIEITTYETNEKSPYDVSDIPCLTCPE
jgi:hypothetical protein